MKEEFLKELEEKFKRLTKLPVEANDSKTNIYYFYCNNSVYKKFKEVFPLDENDMYCYCGVLVKIINVDNYIKAEVKPYEVKDNQFCNTFKKPFYQDLFKPSKEKYVIKTGMKVSKKK